MLKCSDGAGERTKFEQTNIYDTVLPVTGTIAFSVPFHSQERVRLGIAHTFYVLHVNQVPSYNKASFVNPVISGFRILEECIQTSHTHTVI